MMAWPVCQFAVFYIGVNMQSLLMAFSRVDMVNNTSEWTLDIFRNAFSDMFLTTNMLSFWKNSFFIYFAALFIGLPLGLFFSFAIYKKVPLSGTFRVLLFLPSILSVLVMATIFQIFVEEIIPVIVNQITGNKIQGMIENETSRYGTIVFFNIWFGFGTSVLMYSNAMTGVSEEIVESAHLDGVSGFKEFFHITIPLIFPTLSTFLVTGIASIFANQMSLYAFYGGDAPSNLQTYGYYIFVKTARATGRAEYSSLAAMGILMSVIAIALTMFLRRLLEKYGPKED